MEELYNLEQEQKTIVENYKLEHQHGIVMQFHCYENKKTQVLIERARHFQEQVDPLQHQNFILKDKLVGITKVLESKISTMRKLVRPVDQFGKSRAIMLMTANFQEICHQFQEDWKYLTGENEILILKVQNLQKQLVKAAQIRQRLTSLHCQQLVDIKSVIDQQKLKFEEQLSGLKTEKQAVVKQIESKFNQTKKELSATKLSLERERIQVDQLTKMLEYQKNNYNSQIQKLKKQIDAQKEDMQKGHASVKIIYDAKIKEAVEECHKQYQADFKEKKLEIQNLKKQLQIVKSAFQQRESELIKTIQFLKSKIFESESIMKDLSQQVLVITTKLNQLQQELSQTSTKLSLQIKIKTKLEKMLQYKVEECNILTKQLNSLKIIYKNQKEKLKKKIEQLQQKNNHHQAEKAKLIIQHDNKLWKLEEDHKEELQNFKREHVRKVDYDLLKNDYATLETDLLKLKEDRGLLAAKLASYKSMTDTAITQLKALNQEQAKRIKQLEAKYSNFEVNTTIQYDRLRQQNQIDQKSKEASFAKQKTQLQEKYKLQMAAFEKRLRMLSAKYQQTDKERLAQIQRLKHQNQNRIACQLKNFDDKVRAMNEQHVKRLTELDSENKRLRAQLNMTASQCDRFKLLLKQSQQTMGRLQELNKSSLKIQQQAHKQHMKQLAHTHQHKMKHLEEKKQQIIDNLELELKNLRQDSEISRILARHTEEIEILTSRHRQEMSNVQTQAQKRIRQIQQKYKNDRQKLQQKQRKEIQQAVLQLNKIHEQQLVDLHNRLEVSLSQVEEQIKDERKQGSKAKINSIPMQKVQSKKNLTKEREQYNKKYEQFKEEILTTPNVVRQSKKSNEAITNKLVGKMSELQNRFTLAEQLNKQLLQQNRIKSQKISAMQIYISQVQIEIKKQVSAERNKVEKFFEAQKQRLAKQYETKLKQRDYEHYQFSTKLRNEFDHMKRNHEEQLQYYEEKYDELRNVLQERPSRFEDVQAIEQLKQEKNKMKLFVDKAHYKISQAGNVVKYLQRELDNYKTVYDIFKPHPSRPLLDSRRVSLAPTQLLPDSRVLGRNKRRSHSTLANMKNSVSFQKIDQTTPMQMKEFDKIFPLVEFQKRLKADRKVSQKSYQSNLGMDYITKDAEKFLQRVRGQRSITEESAYGSEKKRGRETLLKSLNYIE